MTDWMIWFAVACVLVILEMASGTFYLLMIALGGVAGGIAALLGADGNWQCIVAAVVAAVATTALRRSRFGRTEKVDAAYDPNINLDIGQAIEVDAWREADGGVASARVMYRGAQWDVELAAGGTVSAGSFVIREIRGNRLIVINRNLHNKEAAASGGTQ